MHNEEYFADLKVNLGSGVTTHHGHMPEITLLNDHEAEGIWAMFDYVQVEPTTGNPINIKGYGHYIETYRKGDDGAWRISSKRNVRQRVDVVAAPPDEAGRSGRAQADSAGTTFSATSSR